MTKKVESRLAQVEEVLSDIRRGEGQRIEFKTSFAEANEAIESLCAMANSQGGRVLLGVKDDGTILGLQLGRKTLEDFAHKLRSNTQPNLAPAIYEHDLEGKSIVEAVTEAAPRGTVYYAFGVPLIRVGKSNQLMPPPDIQRKIEETFKAQVLQRAGSTPGDESWNERERQRVGRYEKTRGLFLVHKWWPSSKPGQVADIEIELRQHGEGPLTQGGIKCVEYHLGEKFSSSTNVQTNSEENFRLEVSAYGPFLCFARVRFDDGSEPMDLERYVDL